MNRKRLVIDPSKSQTIKVLEWITSEDAQYIGSGASRTVFTCSADIEALFELPKLPFGYVIKLKRGHAGRNQAANELAAFRECGDAELEYLTRILVDGEFFSICEAVDNEAEIAYVYDDYEYEDISHDVPRNRDADNIEEWDHASNDFIAQEINNALFVANIFSDGRQYGIFKDTDGHLGIKLYDYGYESEYGPEEYDLCNELDFGSEYNYEYISRQIACCYRLGQLKFVDSFCNENSYCDDFTDNRARLSRDCFYDFDSFEVQSITANSQSYEAYEKIMETKHIVRYRPIGLDIWEPSENEYPYRYK